MKESIFNYFDSIQANDHIAHLYGNNSERFEIAARIIADGLSKKQKCLIINDQKTPSGLISRIEIYKINLKKHRDNGEFVEIDLQKSGLNEKNPEDLIELLENIASEGAETKRIVLNRKLSFIYLHENYQLNLEANLNLIVKNNPIILFNQFDITKISSRSLLNILKTHPLVIEEDSVYKNPFYSNPRNIILKLDSEINRLEKLTPKENQVLSGIVNGKSNKAIAEDLSISIRTFETHKYNIMNKTGSNSIIELIKFAIKNGLY